MDKNFEKIVTMTLQNEGGLSNDKYDSGGLTKYGISQSAYPNLDIKNLTLEKAKQIYYRDYFLPIQGNKIADLSFLLANQVFDIGVNCGTVTSIKLLQKSINKLNENNSLYEDGIIGNHTLNALKKAKFKKLNDLLVSIRIEYYKSIVKRIPTKKVFLNGWIIRANKYLSKNEEVNQMDTRDVQIILNRDLGLGNIKIDGDFGPQTKLYLKGVQYAIGVKVDGIFGSKTLAGINKLKKDYLKHTVKHFSDGEFKCKCCGKLYAGKVPMSLKLYLEIIRYHFNKPIIIYSGYRCSKHNANVGGAKYSQHLIGKAADIYVEGHFPKTVYNFVNTLMPYYGGVGKYNTFTHIDIRGTHARWKG